MKGNHILIIDQDDVFISSVENYFKQLGIEVISFIDGVEGYRQIVETNPAMVMLDTVQNNLDGFQICKLVKIDQESDLIVGDIDGVAVVPFERIDEIAQKVQRVAEIEKGRDREVQNGLKIPQKIVELINSDKVKYYD